MVLAQKQIWRPMEQDRGPGYESTQLCLHFFDKGTKNIGWRKYSLFNKCCWEKWLSACRKLELDLCLSPCTSINSNGLRTLISNLKPFTLYRNEQGILWKQ
jgi:hypothetical protein